MTFDELRRWLFKTGTGWLGWSPEVTKQSHMQEIIIAYEGMIEKLKAIHGSSEKEKKKVETASTKKTGGVNKEFFDSALGIRK